MTIKQLKQFIGLGEGFTTEFKRSGTSNLGRELCAFANATGGVVLIGVDDYGEIIGVKNLNRLKSEIQNIARSMEPQLVVDVEDVNDILIVTVPPQNSKPYSFAGKFYLRDGASSQQMSRNEIREFFFKEGIIHFDETLCKRFDLEKNLNKENWKLFAKRAHIPEDMEPLTALENLHLIIDGHMTHAGAWLLAKDITRVNISANVACALFMGTDKVRILDRKDFSSDAFSMIDQVMVYILSKINTEFIIKHVKREERPELPEEALREAVVNAIAHRDYRSTANVQVYIFQDRVEIVSPGGLPAGMTEKDLGKKSVPRNPLLFGMLYRMNAVENIGSGIMRIRSICRGYGVPEPKLLIEENWVTVSFYRKEVEQVEIEKQEIDQVKAHDKAHDEAHDEAHEISEIERTILIACQLELRTTPEILAILGYKSRTGNFKKALSHLIKIGALEMTIPESPRSKKQKYHLTLKGERLVKGLKK